MSSQSMSRLRNITVPECVQLMINYLTRTNSSVRNPVPRGRSLDPNNQHFRIAYNRCLNHNDDAINQLAGYVHDESHDLRAYSPFAQREYPDTGPNAVPRATPQQLNTLNNLINTILLNPPAAPQGPAPAAPQFQAQQNRQPRQAEVQPAVQLNQQPQQRSSSSSTRSTRSSSSASPNTQTLTRLELENLLLHITIDELRNHPQFRRLSRNVRNELIAMWENLHVPQADRAAINPPALQVQPPGQRLAPANAAPNNPPPPPPGLGPAPGLAPPPNNALGPAPAAQPLIRPWFPYFPERGLGFTTDAITNLQRSLMAYFVVYERLYFTNHNSTQFTPEILFNGIVEAINHFVVVALRETNSYQTRNTILLRMHPVIIRFLIDIRDLFTNIDATNPLTFPNLPTIRLDLNRFIRYCHNIFSLPNGNARRTQLFRITNSNIFENRPINLLRLDILHTLINSSANNQNRLSNRISDIYRQGHPSGPDYSFENPLFIRLFEQVNNETNFILNTRPFPHNIPYNSNMWQPIDTLPNGPITDIPTVQGPPIAHPPPNPLANQNFVPIPGIRFHRNVQPPPPRLPRSVSTSRSSRSAKSSSDLTPAEQIALHPSCKDLLKSGTELVTEIINNEETTVRKPIEIINPTNEDFYNSPAGRNLRGFINILKKSCTKVVDKERCTETNLNDIANQLLAKERITHLRIHTIFKQHDTIELVTLYRYYNRHQDVFKSGLENPVNIVVQDPTAIDAGGVRRDFMQNAIKQLFSTKLFVSINEFDNVDVYNFNWNVDIHAIFNIPNTTQNKAKIFKFIGSFIAFALMNQIPLPYHLNRGILANLLYKPEEITDEEYALFYMLDDASTGTSIASALSNPSTHIDTFYEFNNDDHKLDPSIPENSSQNNVITANYRRYLTLLGKYKLIKQNNSDLALTAFKEGFFISRRTLRKKQGRDVTMSMLDALITSTGITTEAINTIEARVMVTNRIGHRLQIVRWFIEILRNTHPYPLDAVLAQGHINVPRTHKEFIQMLMQWWTGIAGFNNNFNYNLTLGTRILATHTCSKTFDIPDTYRTREELYIDLIIKGAQAQGFQFA